MFHFGIGANIDDDPATGNTDWYVYPREILNSLSAQSGDTDTVIVDESQRDAIEFTARRAGSGENLVTENQERNSTGVSYDGRLEVSWKMELNDPANANPVLAREVKMTAKVGNILFQGVFDPGSPTGPVEPNPTSDPGIAYTDGWFDWQRSVPAMYIGASNQTSANATAIQGIFIPGDIDANGLVEAADRAIINSRLGQTDTSYSRGDIDQDGDTDANDLAAWDAIGGGGLPGDFDGNGSLTNVDIDMLAAEVRAGTNMAKFDVTSDNLVNKADQDQWVNVLKKTWYGDANLDGLFNSGDLVSVFTVGEYEDATAGNSGWADGDWNGDADFNSGDFVEAFSAGGYEQGPRQAIAAVPEPTGAALLLIGAVLASLGLGGSSPRNRPMRRAS
jgi:hypothetical protein